MRVRRLLCDVDVSTAFLRATAHAWTEPARLPPPPWVQARRAPKRVAPRALRRVRAEAIARWSAGLYPPGRHRAVAIGSASGALVHLCAALRIPWLPQTVLLPVAARPGTPKDAIAFGAEWGRCVLEPNPEWRLYQVHDPAEGERTRAVSFHLNRIRLGEAYAAFLREALAPGGTIFVIECRRAWPMIRVGPRHLFQLGALGEQSQGDPDDEGSDRADLLGEWRPPGPAELAPEALWGFDPGLRDDLDAFAREHGFKLARILFDEPDDLSPLVAALYAQWYQEAGLGQRPLAVGSFVDVHPRQVLRAGAVPFWLKGDGDDDLDRLEAFLEQTGPWEEIHLTSPRRAGGAEQGGSARWWELAADFGRRVVVHRKGQAIDVRAPDDRGPQRMGLELVERHLDRHGAAYPVRIVQDDRSRGPASTGSPESVARP
ncbi:MAG: hypothetical protein IRZ16_10150 [Myxococcaceae bacterium]|nr:hypothetical protein [Myxococcaceae bacterium]